MSTANPARLDLCSPAIDANPALRLLAAAGACLLVMAMADAAWADLRLCNASSSRVGIAIGYQDAKGWTTEGWWNVGAQTCETLLKGAVPSRFIYVYAIDYDRGGEWSGRHCRSVGDRRS